TGENVAGNAELNEIVGYPGACETNVINRTNASHCFSESCLVTCDYLFPRRRRLPRSVEERRNAHCNRTLRCDRHRRDCKREPRRSRLLSLATRRQAAELRLVLKEQELGTCGANRRGVDAALRIEQTETAACAEGATAE